MIWRELEEAAPEIALLGKERLDRARIALLGTLRKDGSPRISPVEPCFTQGHLVFGAMARSLKMADLRRNPCCVLHSAISDPDGGEGELKLYGHAARVQDQIRDGCPKAWWVNRPREAAEVFSLNIEEATFVSWDIDHGEMIVRRWSPVLGLRKNRRSYP
jgi:hypothetical protein